VKVTGSFVKNLEKESGYLKFQKEVDREPQELLKSKQAGKDEQIHSVEVERETHLEENKQGNENLPPELNSLHQILKKYKVACLSRKWPNKAHVALCFFKNS